MKQRLIKAISMINEGLALALFIYAIIAMGALGQAIFENQPKGESYAQK